MAKTGTQGGATKKVATTPQNETAPKNENPQPAEKTRYSDEELEEFRMVILEKITVYRNELGYFQGQLQEMSENGGGRARGLDDCNEVAEREQLAADAGRCARHLQHLENALLRIQNKTYGICRATGKLIPKVRLRAVPHATLTVAAKTGAK